MDKYGLDSHKIHYHIDRLHDWISGKTIGPIYMEVSPSGACNHRCTFCALDFMGYKPKFLDPDILSERLIQFSELGLKSVMFGGEGEPLLHKQLPQIARRAHQAGLDLALTTNGVLLKPELATELLSLMQWIKISCNGGSKETYHKIHRCRAEDFETLFSNLTQAIKIRESSGAHCTIGLQLLLLDENQREIYELAERSKEVGLDYFVIKPYSHHPLSQTEQYKEISYEEFSIDHDRLQTISSESFNVIVRNSTMENYQRSSHDYDKCLALPFWTYMDASGNIFGCSMHMDKDIFNYGNIYHASAEDIWHGEKRKKSLQWVSDNLDPHGCRVNCRMDKINAFLWSLTNPPEHINFI